MNIDPAQEFGDIVTLFPSRIGYFDTDDIYEQIEERLSDYTYSEEGDILFATGRSRGLCDSDNSTGA